MAIPNFINLSVLRIGRVISPSSFQSSSIICVFYDLCLLMFTFYYCFLFVYFQTERSFKSWLINIESRTSYIFWSYLMISSWIVIYYLQLFQSFPFFGVEPVILDESGKEIRGEGEGYLVFSRPWPGIMRSLYNDHDRYETTYFTKFPGYYYTGDGTYQLYLWFFSFICGRT